MKAAAVALIAFAAASALAAPPEGATLVPAISNWFKDLKKPGSLMPCCSMADCRRVEYGRVAKGRYQALYKGQWYDVPTEAILRRERNPTGSAVACFGVVFGWGTLALDPKDEDDRLEIRCFVLPGPLSDLIGPVSNG